MNNSLLVRLRFAPVECHSNTTDKHAPCREMASATTVLFFVLTLLPIEQSAPADEAADARRAQFFQRAATALDANEGPGGYEKICWNDAGAGISVGKLQWNQKKGDLPLFLQLCHKADAKLFGRIFGDYTAKMLDEKFIRRTAQFSADNSLGRAMKRLLAQPTFQPVQDKLIRNKLAWSLKAAHENGHTSELMVVEIADISNQMGCGGARNALRQSGAKQFTLGKDAIAAFCKQTQNRRANGAKRDAHLANRFSASTTVP